MNWYIGVIKNYVEFSGRARRKEYWMFFLFNILISIGLGFITGLIGGIFDIGLGLSNAVSLIYSLFIFIPSIAVAIRRMHDTGHSGWWILLPVVNIIFLCLESHPNENEYGINPKSI